MEENPKACRIYTTVDEDGMKWLHFLHRLNEKGRIKTDHGLYYTILYADGEMVFIPKECVETEDEWNQQ